MRLRLHGMLGCPPRDGREGPSGSIHFVPSLTHGLPRGLRTKVGDVTAIPERDDPEHLPGPEPASILTRQGRILVEALTRKTQKSQRAVGMYMEARRAMARNNGPESLHVAAYEFREFMNALPSALDVPVVTYKQLQDRVRTFVGDWKSMSGKSGCSRSGDWNGQIDDELRGLLESTTTFVAWFDQLVPSRKAEAILVLKKLARTEHPFPDALMKMRTDEWSDLLGYFNGLTHHNSYPDPDEFSQHVATLEEFLLEQLAPRTFEDQAEIDRLIREVEG